MRDNHILDPEQGAAIRGCPEAPMEELPSANEEPSAWPNPAPTHPTIMLPNAPASILAVVNDSGYLVPICTASDLLRGFKAIWRAP